MLGTPYGQRASGATAAADHGKRYVQKNAAVVKTLKDWRKANVNATALPQDVLDACLAAQPELTAAQLKQWLKSEKKAEKKRAKSYAFAASALRVPRKKRRARRSLRSTRRVEAALVVLRSASCLWSLCFLSCYNSERSQPLGPLTVKPIVVKQPRQCAGCGSLVLIHLSAALSLLKTQKTKQRKEKVTLALHGGCGSKCFRRLCSKKASLLQKIQLDGGGAASLRPWHAWQTVVCVKSFNLLVLHGFIRPSVVRCSRVALTLFCWSPARSELACLGQRGAGQQSVVLVATATAQGSARSTRRRSRRVPTHVVVAAARQLQAPAVCKCCAGRSNGPAVSRVFCARLAVITSSSKCVKLPCQARASPRLTDVRSA